MWWARGGGRAQARPGPGERRALYSSRGQQARAAGPRGPATLRSDTSRHFEKPKSGRIAVKVINHLGDEVMKVFRV